MPASRLKITALKRDLRESKSVAFLIGAGASITSGAPSTILVDEAITASVAGHRYPGEEVGHVLAKLTSTQRVGSVRHVFSHVRPHIGYLSLAALARSRRVLVASLNWDLALEMAAASLGVNCESYDLASPLNVISEAARKKSAGLLVWHLHGSIETDIAHGLWNTVALSDAVVDVLAEDFFSHLTIMVGTSFTDVDVRRAFNRIAAVQSQQPLWTLMKNRPRPEIQSDLDDLLMRRSSTRNVVTDPLLDFDRILLELIAADRDTAIVPNDLRGSMPVAFPEWDKLVLPRWQLLRGHLLREFLLIPGDPRLGKTTLAGVLVQMHRVLNSGQSSVTRLEGGQRLRGLLKNLGRPGDRGEHVILWCDDVLIGLPDNDAISTLQQLRRVVDESNGAVVAIVTTRLARFAELKAQLDLDASLVLDPTPSNWYDWPTLAEFAERTADNAAALDRKAEVLQAIERGAIHTPAAVQSFLLGLPGTRGTEAEAELQQETKAFLHALGDARVFLALVRLAELAPGFITLHDVRVACMETKPSEISLVYTYRVDGHECVGLSHPTYRDAIDAMIMEDRQFEGQLATIGRRTPWIRRGLERLRITSLARSGKPDALVDGKDAGLATSAADMLEIRPTPELLEAIRLSDFDEWSILPLCYELSVSWDSLRKHNSARRFLARVLEDARLMGTYAIAEAAMYLRRGPHPALLDRLAVAIEELRFHPLRHRELALVIDAFLVGRPDHPGLDPVRILRELYDVIDSDDRVLGAIAFAWLYHPEQVASLDVSPLERLSGFTRSQSSEFCWMMKWHFVHQAQNRSLRNRHRITDWALLAAVGESKSALNVASSNQLRTVLRQVGRFQRTAGWVAHAAINMRQVLGGFDESALVADLIGKTPQRSTALATAVATYSTHQEYAGAVSRYFGREMNLSYLRNILANGARVGDWKVSEPNFHFRRSLDDLDQGCHSRASSAARSW